MLKQTGRILGIGCCVFALAACSSNSKKHFWQADVYDANGTQGAKAYGLGDEESVDTWEDSQPGMQVTKEQKIYFGYNKYSIEPSYDTVVASNVDYLRNHPHAKVRIEGHTDEVGSREYNIALGEHRADAFKKALVKAGITDAQITTVSYGKEYPVANCKDSHGARCQLNRRAVIVYTDVG